MKHVLTSAWGSRAALAISATVASLLLSEAALRLARYGEGTTYAVWPPGLIQLVTAEPQDTPGLQGQHQFTITAAGYRGGAIGNASLRVAVFGGSTTESLFVPEGNSWPHLVQQELALTLGDVVWVGNFGKSGRNTRQHVLDAELVMPQFPVQVAVFLVGVNDMAIQIDDPSAAPMSLDLIRSPRYVRKSLYVREQGPSRLLQLVNDAREAKERSTVNIEMVHMTTAFYRNQRSMRSSRSGFIPVLPDMSPYLEEYSRNLLAIAQSVRARGAVPVFVTQPHQWRGDAPPELDALYWWGPVGGWPPKSKGQYYYAPMALALGLDTYNEQLREVARRADVPVVDAARAMSGNARYFYDETHFNEAGSQALAKLISDEVSSTIRAQRQSVGKR